MKEKYSNLPIVMLSMSRWDDPFSSASISLAKEFSKNNLVFYIDNPFTLKDFLTRKSSSAIQARRKALLFGNDVYKKVDVALENLIAVTPQLVLPINWLPQGKVYDYLSQKNNKVITQIIRKIKKDYGLNEYLLFNSFNPFYGHNLPNDIKPSFSVYQSRDDISQSLYVNKHGVQMETKAVSNADLSLATSKELVRKLSKNDKQVHYLPNAADITIFKEVFKPLKKPNELEGIDKKIIAYTGNICHRINYKLLKEIVVNNLDKLILLVGPINNKKFFEYKLDDMPNVLCVGSKPLKELPFYLKYADCTIIPFHCNELTKSIYPLKINEYLATGKPVVSTNFSKDIYSFKDVIYISKTNEEFLLNINNALNEKNNLLKIEKRVSRAEENTWSARVSLFWGLVEKEA